MKRVIFGAFGLFIFYQQAGAHQFRCYEYGQPGNTSPNPLECWNAHEFKEETITWNNRPLVQPPELLATVNSINWDCWYTFESSALDQYIDSCVAAHQPVCFRVKRQIQGPSDAMWLFKEKETGSPPCQLIYNAATITPPSDDARVDEHDPNANLNATFLWACNFDSPDSQEFFVMFTDTSVGVEEGLEKQMRFLRGTPSPFTTLARISYHLLPEDAGKPTVLAVYDITGNLVRNLVNTSGSSGYHEVVWDGKDENGNPVPSGCYFYRLKVGELTLTTKALLLR